jgi:hypothetical protein
MFEFYNETWEDWFFKIQRFYGLYMGSILPLPPWHSAILHGFWFAIFILTPRNIIIHTPAMFALWSRWFLILKAQKFHIVCKTLSKEIPKNRILLSKRMRKKS